MTANQERCRPPGACTGALQRRIGRFELAHKGTLFPELLDLAHPADQWVLALQDSHEQARLLKVLVSNSTFDRGSLSVSYIKPFDLLVDGNESGRLGVRDDFRNWLIAAF